MIRARRFLPIAIVVLLCAACGKSEEERDKARVAEQWRLEQAAAAQERLELEKKRREMEASNDAQTRKEAGDAFAAYDRERPAMTPVQETEALDAAVASVRGSCHCLPGSPSPGAVSRPRDGVLDMFTGARHHGVTLT